MQQLAVAELSSVVGDDDRLTASLDHSRAQQTGGDLHV